MFIAKSHNGATYLCFPEMLAEMILKSSELKCAIKGIILKDIDEQCRKLCSRSPDNSSILRVPRSNHKVSERQFTSTVNWYKVFMVIHYHF